MPENLLTALPYILLALVALIALWFIFKAMTRKVTVVDREAGDVLDEGASRAARNQALIDAPRSMEVKFGDTSAAANTQAVAAAGGEADAEAGASPAAEGLAAVQAAPEPATAPEPRPEPAPAPAAPAGGDDLKRIKGVGPKLVAILAEQGITSFAQIAAWSDADVERVDAGLGRFQGRIVRDQWVEQARLLAAGDEAGFANKFGQNG